jgi:hypothetical protein
MGLFKELPEWSNSDNFLGMRPLRYHKPIFLLPEAAWWLIIITPILARWLLFADTPEPGEKNGQDKLK